MLEILDQLIGWARRISRWGAWFGGVLIVMAAVVVSLDVVVRELFVLPVYRRYAEECGWRHWSFETQDIMDDFVEIFKALPIRHLHNLVSSSDLRLFRKELGPNVRYHVFMAPGRLITPSSMLSELGKIFTAMGRQGGWTLSSGVLDNAVRADQIRSFVQAVRENS